MVVSTTQALTITATRTSGPSANPHFYTDSNCTNMVSEQGNGIFNLSIDAGATNKSYYFAGGSPGYFTFNLQWSIGSDSGTFTSGFQFHSLTLQ